MTVGEACKAVINWTFCGVYTGTLSGVSKRGPGRFPARRCAPASAWRQTPSGSAPGPRRTPSVDPATTQGPLLTDFGTGMLLPTVAPADRDDVELSVLGCRLDILGTNCDQCVCIVQ